jgi:hypothetical protein
MVDASKGPRRITARSISPLTVDHDDLPRISAMCANNRRGTILSPFIILPHHSTTMPESNNIVAAGLAWICTTPNACQTRKSFLIWTVCLCHWLAMYRASSQMIGNRASDCLLIVDGHILHACPLAFEIFRRFQVHVLTLLFHTSHICRFFDVGFVYPLKRAMTVDCQTTFRSAYRSARHDRDEAQFHFQDDLLVRFN